MAEQKKTEVIDMDLEDFQAECNALLEKFYGIGVNDTVLGDSERADKMLFNQSDCLEYPYLAVNEIAQGAGLDRIDKTVYGAPSQEPLTMADQFSTLMDTKSAIERCEAMCDEENQESVPGEKTTFTLPDGSKFSVSEDQLQDLWASEERRM
jgi:hypothetical protein